MAVDFGIRITGDGAVISSDDRVDFINLIIAALGDFTVNITTAASYTAGDRDYNIVIDVAHSGI